VDSKNKKQAISRMMQLALHYPQMQSAQRNTF